MSSEKSNSIELLYGKRPDLYHQTNQSQSNLCDIHSNESKGVPDTSSGPTAYVKSFFTNGLKGFTVDSGATHHVVGDRAHLRNTSNRRPLNVPINVKFGDSNEIF